MRFRSLLFLLLALSFSCASPPPPVPLDLAEAPVIPRPVNLTPTGSSFALTERTVLHHPPGEGEVERLANYLAGLLRPATGFDLPVAFAEATPGDGIYLDLSAEADTLGPEGYLLDITEEAITLTAHRPAGLFYGIQTLRQLLPARIEQSGPQSGPWYLPTGRISDRPEYEHRGVMLDVVRHFFTVEEVKAFIDQIALYKLNRLHLHLTDDQGWRIEIRSWPRLATHGGSTEVGGGEGGYYTQEEYADLVAYAAGRYLTVIPEIDMPGHTNAALASYPELNCDGQAPELYTGTEVGFSTLCVDKAITYQFVDDVVRELAALTPGPYLHIGGDESHVTAKEDYLRFIDSAQVIVRRHGKQVIGWDEIAQTSLQPGTVVQYWNSPANARRAAEQGNRVLFSPAHKAYLDMKYDSTTQLGLAWAAYIELDSAYRWDPATLINGVPRARILGIEAPLWTETVTQPDELEYLVFPRLAGYAEIGWTPAALRDWADYRRRLAAHGRRWEAMGVDFYRSGLVGWEEVVLK